MGGYILRIALHCFAFFLPLFPSLVINPDNMIYLFSFFRFDFGWDSESFFVWKDFKIWLECTTYYIFCLHACQSAPPRKAVATPQ